MTKIPRSILVAIAAGVGLGVFLAWPKKMTPTDFGQAFLDAETRGDADFVLKCLTVEETDALQLNSSKVARLLEPIRRNRGPLAFTGITSEASVPEAAQYSLMREYSDGRGPPIQLGALIVSTKSGFRVESFAATMFQTAGRLQYRVEAPDLQESRAQLVSLYRFLVSEQDRLRQSGITAGVFGRPTPEVVTIHELIARTKSKLERFGLWRYLPKAEQ